MAKLSPEFALIQRYFGQTLANPDYLALGIGDDCALIQSSANKHLAISVDTSIADRHFPKDADAFYIATRALNSSLSDLAAMGAKPLCFTLALSLPAIDHAWLSRFAEGLFSAADAAGVHLIGGDTTKSPTLTITIQVHGEVDAKAALKRSGAQIGDTIYVSGELANAAIGLEQYQHGILQEKFYQAFLNPRPQLALGQKLIGIAHSCIDISDGLLADLGHILNHSHCAASIDANKLPLAAEALMQYTREQLLIWALTGGDDYQLCFTSALNPQQLAESGIKAFAIGEIIAGTGYAVENLPFDIHSLAQGFDHFYEPSI